MSTPAGWYDDGSGRQRWWDGQQWTEHFAPQTPAPDAAQQPDAFAADFDPEATILRQDLPGATSEDAAYAAQQYDAPQYNAPQSEDDYPTQVYPPSDYTAPGYAPPAAPGYADVNATAAYPGAYQAPGASAYAGAPYDANAPYGAYAPVEPAGPQKPPVLGFVGFGLAILGTILACIPFTFIFGAIVLFAAFVVSIIALFVKNTKKWPSITGLVLSIVGGIVGAIIAAIAAFAILGTAIEEFPSVPPVTESESVAPDESEAPSEEPSATGRPSAEEVSAGLTEIIAVAGQTDQLSEEQIACYGEYFVNSDISDETLWVIASGEDALTDPDALGEFSEKLTSGVTECLIP